MSVVRINRLSSSSLLLLPLCIALLFGVMRPAWAVDIVRFPSPKSAHDARRAYSVQLLTEVMRRTEAAYGPFELTEVDSVMTRRRLLLEMREGTHVNVLANPADEEWLRELKAVPVPIDMGLQSWRIALIRQPLQARVNALRTPGQFKALRFGVSSNWVTRQALLDNGFNTIIGGDYEGLFGMLLAQRFDLLPRGLNEVFLEYDQRHPHVPELAVEQRYLLHDHIPSLFFVSPAAPHLAERLNVGMEAMLKDGSLRRFLLSYYGEVLHRARPCERKVIELPLPPLPAELANRPELWFDPLDPRNGFCAGRAGR
ncbi:MAG TPA: hypothetical protein VGM81_00930 [Burkholderiaceae bacterium]|jgi:hypothetical protein